MKSKIIKTVVAVIMTLALLTPPMKAWTPTGNLTTISMDEDSFWNYDFKSDDEPISSSNVDWPLDVIFWYDATVQKINDIYWGPAGSPDHPMYLKLNDGSGWQWYETIGTKSPGSIFDTRTHARQYAANGVNMANATWAKYVVASSHRDNFVGWWSGESETAELTLSQIAEQQGYIVDPEAFYLDNYEY